MSGETIIWRGEGGMAGTPADALMLKGAANRAQAAASNGRKLLELE